MSDEPSINDMPMRVVALKQEPQGKTRYEGEGGV